MEEQQNGITGTASTATEVAETIADPHVSEAAHGPTLFGMDETVFWILVAFVIFWLIVGRKVWAAITGMLDKHAVRVKHQLDEAQKLREDAAALLEHYRDAQRRALQDAEEVIAHARREADHIRSKAAADAVAALGRRERQATDKIAQAEAQAVAEIRTQAAKLAVDAARSLLAQELQGPAGDRLIGESVQVLSQRLN